MTTPVTRRTPTKPGAGARRTAGGKPLHFEWLGIGLIALGIIIIAATWLHGPVPDALHTCMRWLFGEYGAWVIALAMILAGLTVIINLAHSEVTATLVGTAIIFLVAISMLQMTEQIRLAPHQICRKTAGGSIPGRLIAGGLRAVMGSTAWVVLAALGLAGLSLLSEVPLWVMLSWPFRLLGRGLRALAIPMILAARERREEARAAKVIALKEAEIHRQTALTRRRSRQRRQPNRKAFSRRARPWWTPRSRSP